MEPEIENKDYEKSSLTLCSNYFPVGQDSLGLATINQYIYVFYAEKIQVYEQLLDSLTPELVEEIYLRKNRVENFAVSQQFIAVLFTDHELEVRLREYWQVVQLSTSLPKQANIYDIKISDKKLIYRSETQSQEKEKQNNGCTYGFVDICGNQGIKTWDNPINVQKLIHRNKLNSISDFYLTLHENKVKFGMLYTDEDKIKPYQLGELPQQNCQILDVQIFQQKSNYQSEQKITGEGKNEKYSIFFIEVIKNRSLSEQTQNFKLKYSKFYESTIIKSNQANHQDKVYQIYENMLDFFKETQKNCHLSNQETIKYQKQIQMSGDLDEQFQKMSFNPEKALLYVSLTRTIYEFKLQGDIIFLQRQLKKNRKQNLMFVGQNFGIFACQAWSTSSFQERKATKHINLQLNGQIINQQQNHKELQKILEIKTVSEEVQTDALDQFDEKYMNEIIDRLFEKKQVNDQYIQTDEIESEDQSDQIENDEQMDNAQSADTQKANGPQKQQEIPPPIEIIHEREIIKYFPNVLHEQNIKKISSVINSLEQKIQTTFSLKMSELFKNQHVKLKEQCISTLKKICQEQISNIILPKIQQTLMEIFGNKLHEINEYIYSLSIENLLNLRDQFEKDKLNERMLQNQLMKQQIQQVQQFKKAVSKMLEICKVRECQKVAFFHEIKQKFIEVDQKVNSLQIKVNQILSNDEKSQAEITGQIENIRSLLELKHPKKSNKNECSERSCSEGNSNSDKESDSSEQAESDYRKVDPSSSQESIEQFDEYPIVPYKVGPVHPMHQNYANQIPRSITPMHHPMQYGSQYPHQAYYPYRNMREPLPYRYPGATSMPYYGGMFEYHQQRPQYSELPKKKTQAKKHRHYKQK